MSDDRVEAARTYAAVASPEAKVHLNNLLAYADERLKINVGLLAENDQFRKRLSDSSDPISDGEVKLREALRNAQPVLSELLDALESK